MAANNIVHCASCGKILKTLDSEYLQSHSCFQNLPENFILYHEENTNSVHIVSELPVQETPSSPAVVQRTEELQEQLILLVQERPELWNYTLPVSRRIPAKVATSWVEVVKKLPGVDVEKAKAMWKSLRNQYIKARRQLRAYVPSGSGVEDRPTSPSFRFFDQMTFLDEIDGSRPRFSNLSRPMTSNNESAIEVENIAAASSSTARDSAVQQRPAKRQKTSHATINAATCSIVNSLEAPNTGLDGFLLMIRELLSLFTSPQRRLDMWMDILQLIRSRLPNNTETEQ